MSQLWSEFEEKYWKRNMYKKILVKKSSPTKAPVRHYGPALPLEVLIETANQTIDDDSSNFARSHKNIKWTRKYFSKFGDSNESHNPEDDFCKISNFKINSSTLFQWFKLKYDIRSKSRFFFIFLMW